MKRCIYWLSGMSLFFISSGYALDAEGQMAISEIVDQFTHAWNDHKGKGLGDHYAENADFVNIFGMKFSGRQEIEERHLKILDTFLKGSVFTVTDLTVREVKPDVVVVHVQWIVDSLKEKAMKGLFTHTMVKNGDCWEIASSQNTLIRD